MAVEPGAQRDGGAIRRPISTLVCQVPSCGASLINLKEYYQVSTRPHMQAQDIARRYAESLLTHTSSTAVVHGTRTAIPRVI